MLRVIFISKKNRIFGALSAAVIVASIGAFCFFLFSEASSGFELTPDSDRFIREKEPTIKIAWRRPFFENLELLEFNFDGKDVTQDVKKHSNEIIYVPQASLQEGIHLISVKMKQKFLFSKEINKKWAFTVDTEEPYVNLGSDGVLGSREAKIEVVGLTEPGSKVEVEFNGRKLERPSVYGGGTFYVDLDLASPENLMVIEATDRAGNRNYKEVKVVMDNEPPAILGYSPNTKKKIKTATPQIEVAINENGSGISGVRFRINGLDVQGKYDQAAQKAIAFPDAVFEGNNIVEVEVKDMAGNVSNANWTFLIDSSEEFGKRPMAEGATGADVKELKARLLMHGFKSGKMTGTYDKATIEAVKALQRSRQAPETGIISAEEIRVLKPEKLDTSKPIPNVRIVITISRRSLELYSGNELVKVYPIAVGRGGRFKSPVGNHKVRQKIVNPTWYPPDWAGIDHPIPPGPNNPLGNREMKLSKRGYSIHGTNKPASIGSAATHGCIRMYPSDVLELFEVVNVGTPVEVKP